MSDLVLTRPIAVLLLVVAVMAGTQYRRVWKTQGPGWQLWLFGALAGSCLLVLGFLPLG